MPALTDCGYRFGDALGMHFDFGTVMILTLVVAAVVLVVQSGDRLFPLLALGGAGLEALMAFHILSISSEKFQIHVILPAVLVVAGAICWARNTTKPLVTASTIVTLLGALQLALALHL